MDKALAIEENRIKSFNQTTNSSTAKPIGLLYAKKASYLNVSLAITYITCFNRQGRRVIIFGAKRRFAIPKCKTERFKSSFLV